MISSNFSVLRSALCRSGWLAAAAAAALGASAIADTQVGAGAATNRPAVNMGLPGPRPFFNLKPDDFDRVRVNNTNSVVLDVRTPDEYKQGHIPGAVLIDFHAADFKDQISKLDHEKYYLVHCAVGGRSTKACAAMHELGFKHLVNLTGGMEAWQAAGKPVEK